MRSQGNMTPLKDYDNLVTKPKVMESCLPDKEFKVSVLRKLNEVQWGTRIHRQFNEIKKTIHEKMSSLIKRYHKKNKNSGIEEYNDWNEKYNSTNTKGSSKKIWEDGNFEIIQSWENKEKNESDESLCDL